MKTHLQRPASHLWSWVTGKGKAHFCVEKHDFSNNPVVPESFPNQTWAEKKILLLTSPVPILPFFKSKQFFPSHPVLQLRRPINSTPTNAPQPTCRAVKPWSNTHACVSKRHIQSSHHRLLGQSPNIHQKTLNWGTGLVSTRDKNLKWTCGQNDDWILREKAEGKSTNYHSLPKEFAVFSKRSQSDLLLPLGYLNSHVHLHRGCEVTAPPLFGKGSRNEL